MTPGAWSALRPRQVARARAAEGPAARRPNNQRSGARYASWMETEAPPRPSLVRRAVALLILVAAAALAVYIVIGIVKTILWIVVVLVAVSAVLWALKTIVW